MITDKDCDAVLPWLVYLAALQAENALNWQRITEKAERQHRSPPITGGRRHHAASDHRSGRSIRRVTRLLVARSMATAISAEQCPLLLALLIATCE